MDNPDTLATLVHKTKINKIRDIKLKTKRVSNTDPPQTWGELDI